MRSGDLDCVETFSRYFNSFPMKVQPLEAVERRSDPAAKSAGGKSRLKRLFERQRISSLAGDAEAETEPSSVCLDRMIQSFIEESTNNNDKRCGRSCCNCFNGNCDDDLDFAADAPPIVSAAEIVKGLAACASVGERNLLADAARIVSGGGKDGRAVAEGLRVMGYDAGVCRTRWEMTAGYPAGEYEYVDVVVAGGGERLLVDVDFRSEFEIARSTKSYRVVLQALPAVFVGKADRLQQIVAVASEAARQSLTKKGLSFPPWRKGEYMRAKWLSPYNRSIPAGGVGEAGRSEDGGGACPIGEDEMMPWLPPAVRPKAAGARVVPGLASVLRDRP